MNQANTVADGLDARSANDTRGLAVDRQCYESAIASFKITDGKISRIELKPLELNFKAGRAMRGRPGLADLETANRVISEIAELSAPYGTEITNENGVGIIEIK